MRQNFPSKSVAVFTMNPILNNSFYSKIIAFKILPILLLLFYSLPQKVFGEGTKEISPVSTAITALAYMPSINSGPYLGATEDNRLYFNIKDFNTEKLYFGFNWTEYGNTGTPGSGQVSLTNMYYKIFRPDGSVAVPATLWSASGNGFINSYSAATSGPNISGLNPTGYSPLSFTPTVNGDYWIEFYRSADGGATQITPSGSTWAKSTYFDLTVATSTNTKYPGRVHSDKWGMVCVTPATWIPEGPASSEAAFFAYTADKSVVKIDLRSGFRPIAFNVAMNSYGVANNGNWLVDRNSRNDATAPSLSNGYKIFLNQPDATIYPYASIPLQPYFNVPAVSGCGPYFLNFTIDKPGDVKIFFDLNGTSGFQTGTTDRLLEFLDLPQGANSVPWDGKDGLGNALPDGQDLNLKLIYMNGRFNLPLYDAEINANGIIVETVAPVASTSTKLFWNDSGLTSIGTVCATNADNTNNISGTGINNSILGTFSPAHAWNGNGNSAQTIPAPGVSGNDADNLQCNDYGNVRTINTWGWGYISDEINFFVKKGCPNLSIDKTVNPTTAAVGSNVQFTLLAKNLGTIDATEVIVGDTIPSGYTYVSSTATVGSYNNVTGLWTIGNLANLGNETLTITAKVNPTGDYLNLAKISGKEFDQILANNKSSASVFPVYPPVAIPDSSMGNPVGATVTKNIISNDTLQNGNVPLANEVIIDLDPLTPGVDVTFNAPGEGTWAVNPSTGDITFTPLSTFKLDPTPIDYKLTEISTGLSDTTKVKIDYVPKAVNDTSNFAGSPVTVSVTGNDTLGDTVDPTTVKLIDPANPTVPATSVTIPGEGTWSVNPTTGEVTFTPNLGFVGSPTPIDYQVKDNEGNPTTAKIVLIAAPIANSDSVKGLPVGTVASLGNILTDDKKGDGTTPTPGQVTVDLDPATPGDQPSLVVAGEGTWTYNPTTGVADFTPLATFILDPTPIVYKLTETATGKSDTAMLYVDYVPKAVNDTTNFAGSPVTVSVTGNDTLGDTVDPTTVKLIDPANPTVPATSVTIPGEGTWSVNPTTGDVTFTPNPGFVGSPTPIDYQVKDNEGNPTTAKIVLIAAPIANSDSVTGLPVGTVASLGNILTDDKKGDGTTPTPAQVTVDLDPATPGDQPSLVVAGEGTWTYNPTTGVADFTPLATFLLDPTPIVYKLTETATGKSDTAMLYVDYVPKAVNDTTNFAGSPVTVSVTGNDTLGDTVDPTTVKLIDPANPSVPATSVTIPGEGTWSVNPTTGDVTFTPNPGFVGSPTPIDYQVKDNEGNPTTAKIVLIAAPIANSDSVKGVPVGTVASLGNILTDDKKGDGTTPTPAQVTVDLDPATPGDQPSLVVAGEGTWTYNPTTGVADFTPLATFLLDPTPIVYKLTETATGKSDTAMLYVDYVPKAVNDTTNFAGSPVTVNVTTNDTNGDTVDPTTVTLVDPANPTVPATTVTVPGEGTWKVDTLTGAVTFTPEPGFVGSPSPITYTVEDHEGNPKTAQIVLIAAPIANSDSVTGVPVGTVASLGNILTDDKKGDGTTPTPAQVTVDLDPATPGDQPSLVVAGEGTWTYNPTTGVADFTPLATFILDPTPIVYKLTETATGKSDTAMLYVDYVPKAVNDTTNFAGSPVTVNVTTNDTNGDTVDPTTVTLVDPANPTVPATTVTVPGEGTWKVDTLTGAVTFTPEPGFTGSPSPITYTVEDHEGNPTTAQIVLIAAPIANSDSVTGVPVGTVASLGNILTDDKKGDGTTPTPAQVTVDLDPVTPGDQPSLVVAGEGTWTYNPTTGVADFTPLASFILDPTPIVYKLTETATGKSDTAMLYVDYVPKAVNDTTNFAGSPVTVSVTGNDTLGDTVDPTTVKLIDPANPSVPATSVTIPGEGTWSVNPTTGDVTFTPNPGFVGSPTPIDYQVKDNEGNPTTAKIVLIAAPIANSDSVTGLPVGTVASLGNILTDDKKGDGTTPTPAQVTVDLDPATPGDQPSLVVAGEGTWTYNPTTGVADFTPLATFLLDPTPIVYKLTETATGKSDTAMLYVDYVPKAVNDTTNFAGSPVTVSVTGNDTLGDTVDPTTVKLIDPANPSVPATSVTIPGEGTWSVNPTTGDVTFTPNPGFVGSPTPIDYQVKDNEGNPTTAKIVLIAAPIANSDSVKGVPVGTVASLGNILTDDKKGDGTTPTPAQVTVDLDPATPGDQPSLVVAGEGTWTYNPTTGVADFTPLATFLLDPTPIVYKLTETATGKSDTAMLYVDYVPKAVNDTTNFAGSPVTVNVTTNDTNGDTVDPTTVTLVDPANPTVPATTVTVPGEGTWKVDTLTGAVTFTPELGFVGSPSPITYTVEDHEGNPKTAQIVLIAAPIANSDSVTGVPVGTVASLGNILTDDKKGDGTTPTPAQVTVDLDPATPGDQPSLVVAGEGTWTYNPTTGVADFTPLATFILDPTPIVYKLTETATGKSDTAMLYVDYVPKAVNDTTNFAGSPVTVNVTTNDTNGDTVDPTTVTLVDPANPTVPATTVTVPGEGTWKVDTLTGAVTFTPEPGFTGSPSPITYTVEDHEGNPTTAQIVLIAAPIANSDSVTGVPVGTVASLGNILTDDKKGDGTTPTPAQVTVDLDPATPGDQPSLVVAGEGTWTYNPTTGVADFTPLASFILDPTPIVYKLTETATGKSDTAMLYVDYVPKAVNDTTNFAGSPVTVNVTTNDTNGDTVDPTTVTLVDPANPTVPATTVTVPGEGTWKVDTLTGAVTFTPEPGFVGSPSPITYTVEDHEGNPTTAQIVLIAAPIANSDSVTGVPVGTVASLGNILTDDKKGDGTTPTPAQVTVDLDPATPGGPTKFGCGR